MLAADSHHASGFFAIAALLLSIGPSTTFYFLTSFADRSQTPSVNNRFYARFDWSDESEYGARSKGSKPKVFVDFSLNETITDI